MDEKAKLDEGAPIDGNKECELFDSCLAEKNKFQTILNSDYQKQKSLNEQMDKNRLRAVKKYMDFYDELIKNIIRKNNKQIYSDL